MVPPACTGTGLALLVIDKSAEFATCTLVEALLFPVFGSLVAEATDAVSVIVVPEATVVGTFTTNVKVAEESVARLAALHVYGAEVVQVHPDPLTTDSDANVVLAGTAPDNTTVVAVAGPLFVTVCV